MWHDPSAGSRCSQSRVSDNSEDPLPGRTSGPSSTSSASARTQGQPPSVVGQVLERLELSLDPIETGVRHGQLQTRRSDRDSVLPGTESATSLRRLAITPRQGHPTPGAPGILTPAIYQWNVTNGPPYHNVHTTPSYS